MLPSDLKNYHADEDAFVMLTPGECAVAIVCLLVAGLILSTYGVSI